MKRKTLLALLLAAGAASAHAAQISPPVIQWQRSFRGTNLEFHACVRQLPDGGYVVGTITLSPPGGNKTSVWNGSYDMWLLRLDSRGEKLWERSFGGTNSEFLIDLQVTADGGLVLVGDSHSPTSESKAAPNFGNSDYWMLKLDGEGRQLWDKTYGGTGFDRAMCVVQMSDGGFALGGFSYSPASGNKSSTNFHASPYFGGDSWIVRTDAVGNMIWDRSLGGTSEDASWSLYETAGGGIMVANESRSSVSGNKTTASLGAYDYWVTRLDAAGNMVDERAYGGGGDDFQVRIKPAGDGGFILAGNSSSPPDAGKTAPYFGGQTGPTSPRHGDFWLVKVDSSGNRAWDRSFGGDSVEILYDTIVEPDGSIVGCGISFSGTSGNKVSSGFVPGDAWIVKLDGNGDKLWELCLGGSGGDSASSIRRTTDGGYIVAGSSSSNPSGNKTSPAYGMGDLWIIKLGPDALTAPQVRAVAQSAESIRTDGFRLEVRPPPNAPTNALYVLEASTNMTHWEAIRTNPLPADASAVEFRDAAATNRPSRFYGARMER